MTTSIAWKLKLCAALGVTGVSLGLVYAGGEEPKPAAPPTPVVAKPAEPSFVFATVTPRVERVEPRQVVPATVAVWSLSGDGTLGESRSMGLTPAGLPPGSIVDESSVSVGPDGRSVMFVASRPDDTPGKFGDAPNKPAKHDRYVAKSLGEVTKLGEWQNDYARPFWSPDGGSIYYLEIDWKKTLVITSLLRMPEPTCFMTRIGVVSGRRERVAIDGDTRPLAVSPDGKTMIGWVTHDSLFSSRQFRLCVAKLPGGATRHLGKWSDVGFSEAVFSPDGKRAVVAHSDLVPYPKNLLPAGSGIAIYPARRLHLVDLAAGTVTPLATQPAAVPDYGHGVRWSPDGRRVAFTDAKGWSHGSDGMQVVEPCVVTCDPDGKNPVRVAMPTPKPASFQFTGYGPQFVAWK